MKDNIRVAMIQPKPYPEFSDPRNLGHALMLMQKLRGESLDVVCMPEYFPYLGEQELGQAARELQSYIVAGLVEQDGDRLYNTATLFDRSGRILGRQRKRNVTTLERNRQGISPGDNFFRAFATDFGKIGIPVCIDFWGQPEAAAQLTDQGAEIVFNISLFPILKGHWKTAAMVRAFDNFMPVVGVNTADFNAMIDGKRYHQNGGGSFVLQPPKMLDRPVFQRWFKSLDNVHDWELVELDVLEQIHIQAINLSTIRRFRREFWKRFGIERR